MRRKLEQDLALSLAVAVRTAAYYEPKNAVMRESTGLLLALLKGRLDGETSVSVSVHSHCVFIGRTRIRSTLASFSRFAYLVDLYGSWGIQSLTFFESLGEAELTQLLEILAREKDRSSEILSATLQGAGVRSVQVDLAGPAGDPTLAVAPVEAYAACVQMAEDMQLESGAMQASSSRQLRHVTQAVVDQVLSEPHSLMALTTIKDFDRYLISHSTNVAILSVVLGQRLGLSKTSLGELCLAAFLHDSGKLEIDAGVLSKAEEPDRAGMARDETPPDTRRAHAADPTPAECLQHESGGGGFRAPPPLRPERLPSHLGQEEPDPVRKHRFDSRRV